LQGNHDALNRGQESKLILENTLGVAENTMAALTKPDTQPSPADSAPPAGAAPENVVTRVVIKTSDQMRAQLELLRLRYGDDHPDVKKLKGQLEQALQLEAQQPAVDRSVPVPIAPKAPAPKAAPPRQAAELAQSLERIASLKTSIAAATREIGQRTADQERILRDIGIAQGRLDRLPIHEQEMARVLRDYEMSKANYRSLLDKKFSAEMSTDMERRQKSERFYVLDPARVPEIPVRPNRPLLNLGGSLAGLALGLVLGIGVELRKNVVLGEWELPPDVPVLGRLPYIHPVTAAAAAPRDKGRLFRNRMFRWALVSSAVLSFVGIAAFGIYYLRTHF